MSKTESSGQFVFPTGLGFVALAWGPAGLTRLSLPERDRSMAEQRAAKWNATTGSTIHLELLTHDVPDFVHEAVALVRRYADGGTVDFSVLPVEFDGVDPFCRSIYQAALMLRQGETTTYGELAERAGFPGMAREAGTALGRNPLPLVVPCHRIIAAGGKIGGFSAPGGARTKERLLAHEGVVLGPSPPAQATFGF